MSGPRALRVVALTCVVSLGLLGVSAIASATMHTGCHRSHRCTTSGSTAAGDVVPAPFTVKVHPDPVVETGPSDVVAEIHVDTDPSFAGDEVNITSSQLQAACGGEIRFWGDTGAMRHHVHVDSIQVIIDEQGKAHALVRGRDCAPGMSVVEADLAAAPYDTGLTTLNVKPPS